MGALTRAWQILLKGIEDGTDSPRPLASAEMTLIRLAYAPDLPTPEDALRKLAASPESAPRHVPPPAAGGARAARGAKRRAVAARAAPRAAGAAPAPRRRRRRGSRVSRMSSRWRAPSATSSSSRRWSRRCVSIGSSRAASSFHWSKAPRRRCRKPSQSACRNGLASGGWWRWSQGSTAPTLREMRDAEAERTRGAAAHPLVRKVLEQIPGRADRRGARPRTLTPPAGRAAADDEVGYTDAEPAEDDDS